MVLQQRLRRWNRPGGAAAARRPRALALPPPAALLPGAQAEGAPLDAPRRVTGPPVYSASSIEKYSGQVFDTQPGSQIETPGIRSPASAKAIAMRWSS